MDRWKWKYSKQAQDSQFWFFKSSTKLLTAAGRQKRPTNKIWRHNQSKRIKYSKFIKPTKTIRSIDSNIGFKNKNIGQRKRRNGKPDICSRWRNKESGRNHWKTGEQNIERWIKNERNWIKLWIENKRNGDRETKLKYEISGEIEWIRKRK